MAKEIALSQGGGWRGALAFQQGKQIPSSFIYYSMLNSFIDIKPHHLNFQSRFLLGETFLESQTRKKKDKIPNAKLKELVRVKVYESCWIQV